MGGVKGLRPCVTKVKRGTGWARGQGSHLAEEVDGAVLLVSVDPVELHVGLAGVVLLHHALQVNLRPHRSKGTQHQGVRREQGGDAGSS